MARRTSLRPQLIFILVWVVVAVGMVRIAQYHWREGTVIIGGALLLAAGLRAVLAPEWTGLLGIRRRAVDVLTYGALGLLMLAVALTITGGPLASG
ncbi:MAG: DUF3017 domain-containing protein [Pseudonocardiaceae bacterium]